MDARCAAEMGMCSGKPIGQPLPTERTWRFVTVDATTRKTKCKNSPIEDSVTSRCRRNGELVLARLRRQPMDNGKSSHWQGDLERQRNHVGEILFNVGQEEFLLMRSTFEIDNLNYDSYRLAILARQGFHVYLNGHKIHTYIWWQDKPQCRSIVLDQEQTQHLKKARTSWRSMPMTSTHPVPQIIMPRSMPGSRHN